MAPIGYYKSPEGNIPFAILELKEQETGVPPAGSLFPSEGDPRLGSHPCISFHTIGRTSITLP